MCKLRRRTVGNNIDLKLFSFCRWLISNRGQAATLLESNGRPLSLENVRQKKSKSMSFYDENPMRSTIRITVAYTPVKLVQYHHLFVSSLISIITTEII